MGVLPVQVVAQVPQTFPLLADGTAAGRLQVGELLQLLPVDFVCFLVSATDKEIILCKKKKACIIAKTNACLQ